MSDETARIGQWVIYLLDGVVNIHRTGLLSAVGDYVSVWSPGGDELLFQAPRENVRYVIRKELRA